MSGYSHSKILTCCRYCFINDEAGIAQCLECGKWFCNTPALHKGSHIVIHLSATGHQRMRLHPTNPFFRGELSCPGCANPNVFSLGTAMVRGTKQLLCRFECFDAMRDKQARIATERLIEPLIFEKRFRPEILRVTCEASIVNLFDIDRIERHDNGVSIFKGKVDIRKIPDQFENLISYQSTYLDLIAIQREYELAQSYESILRVHISWIPGPTWVGKFRVPDKLLQMYTGFVSIAHDSGWKERAVFIKLEANIVSVRLKPKMIPPETEGTYSTRSEANTVVLERQEASLDKMIFLNKTLLGLLVSSPDPTTQPTASTEAQGGAIPHYELHFHTMNESQKEAIVHAINEPLTLIQGPPGTGKTTVASYIIKYKLHQNPGIKILACAPSNTATDNIAERLSILGIKVVRMLARSNPETAVPHLTMEAYFKRKPVSEYEKLSALLQKQETTGYLTGKKGKKLKERVMRAEIEILEDVQVVCCTCSTVADGRLDDYKFKFVLIDEATQSVEPETMCALTLGVEQLVLLGDQKQLGPTVMMHELEEAGYGRSLYERLLNTGHKCIMLNQQYRMHPIIADFSSKQYYDDRVSSMVSQADRWDRKFKEIWMNVESPVIFCDISDPEEIARSGTSYVNRFEYVAIEYFLRVLHNGDLNSQDVGVISFYDGQVKETKRRLDKLGSEVAEFFRDVEVSSVDGFQGREKKYIILSCVRSNSDNYIGFVNDERRLNVALTRAQYGLVVIGNSAVLGHAQIWGDLIAYYKIRNLIIPYYEYRDIRNAVRDQDKQQGKSSIFDVPLLAISNEPFNAPPPRRKPVKKPEEIKAEQTRKDNEESKQAQVVKAAPTNSAKTKGKPPTTQKQKKKRYRAKAIENSSRPSTTLIDPMFAKFMSGVPGQSNIETPKYTRK
mmetsp:Transcript_8009/g.15773  ORF Transcript_8009/g.15773 Transcript_8009/m.15773 type:complete len:901 (-) Transcript_8009:2134-4836(-)